MATGYTACGPWCCATLYRKECVLFFDFIYSFCKNISVGQQIRATFLQLNKIWTALHWTAYSGHHNILYLKMRFFYFYFQSECISVNKCICSECVHTSVVCKFNVASRFGWKGGGYDSALDTWHVSFSLTHTHTSVCTINPLPPEEESEGVMWVESGGDQQPSPTSPLHHHINHKMRQIELLHSLALSNYVGEVRVRGGRIWILGWYYIWYADQHKRGSSPCICVCFRRGHQL